MGKALRAQLARDHSSESKVFQKPLPWLNGAFKLGDNRYSERGIMNRGFIIGKTACHASKTSAKCQSMVDQGYLNRYTRYCSTRCSRFIRRLYTRNKYKDPNHAFVNGKILVEIKPPNAAWFKLADHRVNVCRFCEKPFPMTKGKPNTCSDECKSEYKQFLVAEKESKINGTGPSRRKAGLATNPVDASKKTDVANMVIKPRKTSEADESGKVAKKHVWRGKTEWVCGDGSKSAGCGRKFGRWKADGKRCRACAPASRNTMPYGVIKISSSDRVTDACQSIKLPAAQDLSASQIAPSDTGAQESVVHPTVSPIAPNVVHTDPDAEAYRELRIMMADDLMAAYKRKLDLSRQVMEADDEIRCIIMRRALEEGLTNGTISAKQMLSVLASNGQAMDTEAAESILQSALQGDVSIQDG
jgi:hypothetical protein